MVDELDTADMYYSVSQTRNSAGMAPHQASNDHIQQHIRDDEPSLPSQLQQDQVGSTLQMQHNST